MTAAWATKALLAVDCETTGVDPWTDSIVEIAAVPVHPDGRTGTASTYIVDPGRPIPEAASNIHGITTERAKAEGTRILPALGSILTRIADHDGAIVIYNARFDWPLIRCEAERCGLEFPDHAQIIDPMVIDKHIDTYRKGSRKLVDVAAHYGVTLDAADAHGALADATASGRLVWAMTVREPRMAGCELGLLVESQERWAEEQRSSFVAYKQRNDPAFSSPAGWPIPAREAA